MKVGCAVSLLAAVCWWKPVVGKAAPEAPASMETPAIVRDGFMTWAKKGSTYAFDVWQKGGLLEDDRKPQALFNYFRRMDRALGNYKSYEVIDSKAIGPNSSIIYISMNFERAAVYGRFLVYRTEKAWVIQNMDFSPKPEAIMPWLAFNEGNYQE